MSVQATSYVIEHSKHKGSAFVVMFMIANHAHADGTGAYPSTFTLAKESRITERQVRRLLPELEASGELVVFWSKGRRPHEYAVRMGAANAGIVAKLQTEYDEEHADPNLDKLSALECVEPPDSLKTNPDKLSTLTRTSATANPDIRDISTRTSEPAHIRNKPSLEPSIEKRRAAASSQPVTKSSKKQERVKTRPDLEDQAWLARLRGLDENRGIDVDALYARMLDWCEKNRCTPSRLRLLKWLDGERTDAPMSYVPAVTSINGNRKRAGETFTAEIVDEPPFEVEQPELRPAENVAPEHQAMWKAFHDQLAKQLHADFLNTWFGKKAMVFDGVDFENNRLNVRTGRVTRDWIDLYYREQIYNALVAAGLAEFTVEITVEADQFEEVLATA